MEVETYDMIAIGTGSAMNVVDAFLRMNPGARVAVIDKDDPGGICLTRGCIPTKILAYAAEVARLAARAREFGVDASCRGVDFRAAMERMRSLVRPEVEAIRRGLSSHPAIDYYPEVAEFVGPYRLRVGDAVVESRLILLCSGSRPLIPPIGGLEEVGYLTSDTVLDLEDRPDSLVIVGGGYVAAEYGNFFSAAGIEVTVVGRNPRFLPQEEPEVSEFARRELGRWVRIETGLEVVEASRAPGGGKRVVAVDRSGRRREFEADEILVAAGRAPNSDLLHPERAGIETYGPGWIKVDDRLETTLPGVWACGDANGRHLFKHVANYESEVVFRNAVLGEDVRVDYRVVPHAVFTHPEVASVGMGEAEAVSRLGADKVLVAFEAYEDTARGEAMGAEGFFKGLVDARTGRILGAHAVGPCASTLIQEVVNAMRAPGGTFFQIAEAMHIHPALSEVVQRAFGYLMPLKEYHRMLEERFGISIPPPA